MNIFSPLFVSNSPNTSHCSQCFSYRPLGLGGLHGLPHGLLFGRQSAICTVLCTIIFGFSYFIYFPSLHPIIILYYNFIDIISTLLSYFVRFLSYFRFSAFSELSETSPWHPSQSLLFWYKAFIYWISFTTCLVIFGSLFHFRIHAFIPFFYFIWSRNFTAIFATFCGTHGYISQPTHSINPIQRRNLCLKTHHNIPFLSRKVENFSSPWRMTTSSGLFFRRITMFWRDCSALCFT